MCTPRSRSTSAAALCASCRRTTCPARLAASSPKATWKSPSNSAPMAAARGTSQQALPPSTWRSSRPLPATRWATAPASLAVRPAVRSAMPCPMPCMQSMSSSSRTISTPIRSSTGPSPRRRWIRWSSSIPSETRRASFPAQRRSRATPSALPWQTKRCASSAPPDFSRTASPSRPARAAHPLPPQSS